MVECDFCWREAKHITMDGLHLCKECFKKEKEIKMTNIKRGIKK